MQSRDRAWCALVGGFLVYDLFAREGQTLSEGFDHYIQARPRVTRIVTISLVAHLINLVPERYDPLSRTYLLLKRRKVKWDRVR
jgi:hypothetical protein